MDTFTVITALVALSLIYLGERLNSGGVYLLLASMFWILLAWRMAEQTFYIASAAVIFVLVYRAFFSSEDVSDD